MVGLTAENAENAEKRIHHGVARKVTDLVNRRRTQTDADFWDHLEAETEQYANEN
jgi:hypothetical protein